MLFYYFYTSYKIVTKILESKILKKKLCTIAVRHHISAWGASASSQNVFVLIDLELLRQCQTIFGVVSSRVSMKTALVDKKTESAIISVDT